MADELIIRRYEERDLDGLFEMIKGSFLTPVLDKVYEESAKQFWLSEYSKENIIDCTNRTHFYVAELGGKIVGSGAVGEENEMAYICGVFINPLIQGRGIGAKMIEVLEKDELCLQYRKVFLTAALSAGKFYQKQGYTYRYDIPEIILDGCLDVVYMEKEL